MPDADIAARQHWMATLAASPLDAIAARLSCLPALPSHERLRGPEIGLVMVRGRAGGEGAAFNLGEMTLTRCTVRTESGQIGHSYISGRDKPRAELAAVLDAALQDPARRETLMAGVVAPLAEALAAARARIAGEAEATRVAFATLATMRG